MDVTNCLCAFYIRINTGSWRYVFWDRPLLSRRLFFLCFVFFFLPFGYSISRNDSNDYSVWQEKYRLAKSSH